VIASFLFFCLAGFGLAADPISPPIPQTVTTAQDRELQAERFVADKLQLWQRRLNLAKWNIRANLVRSNALKPKTLGGIHWDTATMTATVDVMSTYDYKLPFDAMLDDMEFTVVHELVHLQLSSLPRSEASRSAEEHAVNEIASSLLKLVKK
jgi:hypothetical protein